MTIESEHAALLAIARDTLDKFGTELTCEDVLRAVREICDSGMEPTCDSLLSCYYSRALGREIEVVTPQPIHYHNGIVPIGLPEFEWPPCSS